MFIKWSASLTLALLVACQTTPPLRREQTPPLEPKTQVTQTPPTSTKMNTPPKSDERWSLITLNQQSLAQISVEEALYERSDQPHFFLHFKVENRSDHPIAVDLRDYWNVMHPNQWGFSNTPQRQEIDETRMAHHVLDEAAKASLQAAFVAHLLPMIPPGGSYDFYRDFNASGHKDVDAQAGPPYLILSLDGELVVTDGSLIEQQSLAEPFAPEKTDLVLKIPVLWKTIPQAAVMFVDR